MKTQKRIAKLMVALLAVGAFLPMNTAQVEAADLQKQSYTFGESNSQTQYQGVELPAGAVVQSVTTNTGNVSYSQGGNFLNLTLTGGTSTGSSYNPYKYSQYKTDSRTSSSPSFDYSLPYNSGGYSGSLYQNGSYYVSSGSLQYADTKWVTNQTSNYYSDYEGYSGYLSSYVYSGALTPTQTKQITKYWATNDSDTYKSGYCDTRMGDDWQRCQPKPNNPSQLLYSDAQGYSGWIQYDSYKYWQTEPPYSSGNGHKRFDWTRTWYYSGTISKPGSDTRVYRYQGNVSRPYSDTRRYTQNYAGTVYQGGTDYTYGYTVTVNYTLDFEAPTGTITQTPTEWTNGNVTLNLSNIQDTGGAGYQSVTLPNGTTSTSTSVSYVATTNGTYSFILRDKIGNTRTLTHTVTNIDRTLPTASISQTPTDWTNGNVTLNLTDVKDNESGIKQIKKPDGTIQPASASSSHTVTANGTYSFEVEDVAGNKTVKSITVSNIDRLAPTANLSASPTALTKGNVTLSLSTIRDTGAAGVKEVLLPDGTKVLGSANLTFLAEENGEYSFVIYDNAGNTTTKTITVSNIDREAPTGDMTYTPEDWTNKSVVINLRNIEDVGTAGYQSTRLPNGTVSTATAVTFTVNGNGDYPFLLTDRVGNQRTLVAEVRNIDHGLPIITLTEKNRTDSSVKVNVKIQDTGDLK